MPWFTGAAAMLGLLAVGLGAFAAHGLRLEAPASAWFETANRYHFYHALALLALAFSQRSGSWFEAAAWSWFLGVLIFSGTLYAMALGAPRWFGAITPIGGLALMLGWLMIFIAWLRQ